MNTQTTHTQACAGHPDEGFGLTQKSQNTQKNIVSRDKQSTLDENSQNFARRCARAPAGWDTRVYDAWFCESLRSLRETKNRVIVLSACIINDCENGLYS